MPKKNDDLTQRQKEVYEAWYANECDDFKTAKELGIAVVNLRKTLFFCGKKGYRLDVEKFHAHLPTGWKQFLTTAHVKYDDPDRPEGYKVQEWVRGKPFDHDLVQFISEYLKARIPVNIHSIKPFDGTDPELQLEWFLTDVHFAMLSWGKETGEDYDINIAKNLVIDSGKEIFARHGNVEETLLVLGGDNFHADFYDAKTERSGNYLNVDSRYGKMVHTGTETFISAIEVCLHFSKRVKVIVLYGNHDKQTSSVLPWLLHYYFLNESRVTIDLSPAKYKDDVWGCVAKTYHHGDGVTKQRLCNDFALRMARSDYFNLKYFFAKQGHLHKEHIEDVNGVIYEIVPSPVAQDDYANSSCFSSQRATTGVLYHKRFGKIGSHYITPQALEYKKEVLNV